MTIKQQGGIFGRNPTFNDVEVEGNLTVGGSAISAVGTIASQDANNVNIDGGNIDGTTIGSANASAGTFSNATVENDLKVGRYLQMTDSGGSFRTNMYYTTDDLIISTGTSSGSRSVIFQTEGQERWRINAAGNFVAGSSGLGIDFSATSGTGTSELFDDYEEGTWTPTLTTDGTDFDSVTYDGITYGWYTKVGNVVAVGGRLRTDAVTVGSGSGNVVIGGLPFSVVKQSGIAIGYAASFVTKFPQFAEAPQGQTYIKLYGLASLNASSTTLTTANVSTSTNSNYITFSGVYQA